MTDKTIECPKCGHEFSVADALSAVWSKKMELDNPFKTRLSCPQIAAHSGVR